MANDFELSFTPRTDFGKAATRRLRRLANEVPAVIYGAHQDPEHVVIADNIIKHALDNEAFYSHILTLKVNDKKEKAVLKSVQRDPATRKVIHLDFLRVSAKEKITMQVPIHFLSEDEAPGVKDEQGVIMHAMTELEIRCLPADLPEFIEIDVSQLKLNESIHLSQVTVPAGVELVGLSHGENEEQNDPAVISIHIPKEEPEPEAEVAAEGEEGAEAEAAEGDDETKAEGEEAKPEGGEASNEQADAADKAKD